MTRFPPASPRAASGRAGATGHRATGPEPSGQNLVTASMLVRGIGRQVMCCSLKRGAFRESSVQHLVQFRLTVPYFSFQSGTGTMDHNPRSWMLRGCDVRNSEAMQILMQSLAARLAFWQTHSLIGGYHVQNHVRLLGSPGSHCWALFSKRIERYRTDAGLRTGFNVERPDLHRAARQGVLSRRHDNAGRNLR